MQTTRQTARDAKELFRLCQIGGSLDEALVRQVVQLTIAAGRPNGLRVLSRFQRLVRLDVARHRAAVDSAVPLPTDVRTAIESSLSRLYGPDVATSFAEDPTLLGGVRITVGSDVYDGTIKAGLAALEAHF